jgi:hypothetical protein
MTTAENSTPVLARRVFFWAGIYGLLALFPQYFLEGKLARDYPPALTHPEYFYGFIGVGVAWQLAFLVISRDPVRLRPVMIPAVVEKFSFAISTFVLFAVSRVPFSIAAFALIDTVLGILFLISFGVSGSMAAETGPRHSSDRISG